MLVAVAVILLTVDAVPLAVRGVELEHGIEDSTRDYHRSDQR